MFASNFNLESRGLEPIAADLLLYFFWVVFINKWSCDNLKHYVWPGSWERDERGEDSPGGSVRAGEWFVDGVWQEEHRADTFTGES